MAIEIISSYLEKYFWIYNKTNYMDYSPNESKGIS